MSELFQSILVTFKAHADAELQVGMQNYMRGKFDFFGIKSPARKEISRSFFQDIKKCTKAETVELIERLWKEPQRELHYLAQELFFKVAKMHINEEEDIIFLEWMVTHNSWWDTIDFIAPKLMKIYFDKFPENRNSKVDEWVKSNNIWLQRSAILIHLKQKASLDADYLFDTILRLNDTNEFFIDKAIGWVLRENAKHHGALILDFVKSNEKNLSKLSFKEALKHFPQ